MTARSGGIKTREKNELSKFICTALVDAVDLEKKRFVHNYVILKADISNGGM